MVFAAVHYLGGSGVALCLDAAVLFMAIFGVPVVRPDLRLRFRKVSTMELLVLLGICGILHGLTLPAVRT